jgi:hypothetical protein
MYVLNVGRGLIDGSQLKFGSYV